MLQAPALHVNGAQSCVVGVAHAPAPLQVAALVAMFPEHEPALHTVPAVELIVPQTPAMQVCC